MTRIISVEAIPLDARLKKPFKFGKVVRTTSSNVLVRIATDDGSVGWGEACPVPQLTGETRESIVALIDQRVGPELIGCDPTHWRAVIDVAAARLHGCPATRAAIETSILDLAGKLRGVSVAELLGGRYRDSVEIHGSVGWEEDPAAVAEVATSQAEQYRMLKLYVGRGDLRSDLGRLAAARSAVGDDHPFIVDVNGLWTPLETMSAAATLADLGVVILEQPVRPADRRGMAEVCRVLGERHAIKIVADEGVLALADVVAAAQEQTAHVVNVGMTKLGGPAVAYAAAMLASSVHLGVLVGSVVELGIATAAGLQVAAAIPESVAPAYLGGPHKYVTQISGPLLLDGEGFLQVPTGPGLGIDIDEDAIATLDLRDAHRSAAAR